MMSNAVDKVQESITIALDAADAASEVTSEYNKVKKQHQKLENSVKSIHRYTVLIFGSSMLAAVAALVFASMLYFRTMSELTTMTTTSREALIVFAENVEQVNGTLDRLKSSMETQQQLLLVNERLIEGLEGLKDSVVNANADLVASIEKSNKSAITGNADVMNKMSKKISNNMAMQLEILVNEVSSSRQDVRAYMDRVLKNTDYDGSLKSLLENQAKLEMALRQLAEQNAQIIQRFEDQENNISFP